VTYEPYRSYQRHPPSGTHPPFPVLSRFTVVHGLTWILSQKAEPLCEAPPKAVKVEGTPGWSL
jgi:hypothetical protein